MLPLKPTRHVPVPITVLKITDTSKLLTRDLTSKKYKKNFFYIFVFNMTMFSYIALVVQWYDN